MIKIKDNIFSLIQRSYEKHQKAIGRYRAIKDIVSALYDPGFSEEDSLSALKKTVEFAGRNEVTLNNDFMEEIEERYRKYFEHNLI